MRIFASNINEGAITGMGAVSGEDNLFGQRPCGRRFVTERATDIHREKSGRAAPPGPHRASVTAIAKSSLMRWRHMSKAANYLANGAETRRDASAN